mgnify:CR=1 FL=1
MNVDATVILNGDEIHCDEIIRENVRLTLQHEVDQQKIQDLQQMLEGNAVQGAADTAALNAMLGKAIADLHFVMAGGDPCKVCTVKCAFGEGNCKPVWRGEESST